MVVQTVGQWLPARGGWVQIPRQTLVRHAILAGGRAFPNSGEIEWCYILPFLQFPIMI